MRARWWGIAGLLFLLAVGLFVFSQRPALPEHERRSPSSTTSSTTAREVRASLLAAVATDAPSGVTGHVRDANGAPIADAIVCARCSDHRLSDVERRESICVRSEESGAYTISALLPARYSIGATVEGYAPARHEGTVELERGAVRDGVDIVVKTKGLPISGVVEDLLGGPIGGAHVSLGSLWRSTDPSEPVVETSARGAFTIWARAGKTSLRFEADGYATGRVEVNAPREDVLVQLIPESSIRGRVVMRGANEPVSGAIIDAEAELGGMSVSLRTSALADTQGAFTIDRLTAGPYKLRARSATAYGESPTAVIVGFASNINDVVVELEPATASLDVSVLDDESSEPLGGCNVVAQTPAFSRSARTSTAGRALIRGLSSGPFGVVASCEGHGFAHTKAESDSVVLRLRRGLSIKGHVTAASGELPKNIEVDLYSEKSSNSFRPLFVDPSGDFQTSGVEPDHYRLKTQLDDVEIADPVLVTVSAELDPTVVEIALRPMGEIRGRVVDRDGRAIAGVNVTANRGGDLTDARGRFRIGALSLGEHTLKVSDRFAGDLHGVPTVVKVDSSAPVDVVLIIERVDLSISGTVVDEKGAPVRDAFVAARRGENAALPPVFVDEERPAIITDARGAFVIRGLAEGKYVIAAKLHNIGDGAVRDVLAGSSTTIVLDRHARASGIVFREDGSSPEQFFVLAEHESKTIFARRDFSRTEGRWSIEDLPAGRVRITATEGQNIGGRNGFAIVQLAPGDDQRDIIIRFSEGTGRIVGRVVDVDARPLPGLQISVAASPWRNESWKQTRSDENGAFVLEHLAAEEMRIVIESQERVPKELRCTVRAHETCDLGEVAVETARR